MKTLFERNEYQSKNQAKKILVGSKKRQIDGSPLFTILQFHAHKLLKQKML